jgi:hypothetical protein
MRYIFNTTWWEKLIKYIKHIILVWMANTVDSALCVWHISRDDQSHDRIEVVVRSCLSNIGSWSERHRSEMCPNDNKKCCVGRCSKHSADCDFVCDKSRELVQDWIKSAWFSIISQSLSVMRVGTVPHTMCARINGWCELALRDLEMKCLKHFTISYVCVRWHCIYVIIVLLKCIIFSTSSFILVLNLVPSIWIVAV